MPRFLIEGRAVLAVAFTAAALAVGTAVPAAAAPATAGQVAVPLVASSSVYTWGDNESGQVGDGTTTEEDRPDLVGLHGAQQVVTGSNGTFGAALMGDGTVEAWGNNVDGGLGDDSTTNRLTPVHVVGLTGITQIAAGDQLMLALDSSGNVWSWGFNSDGQLGNGTSGPGTNTDVPAKVPGLTGITQIDSGDGLASFAVDSAGALFAWGDNSEGNLGDGTTTQRDTPIQVPDLPKVKEVSAGLFTTLVIAGTTNTLWGWGLNGFGTIGDGTSTQRLSPRMTTLTGVTQVNEGVNVSAAIVSGGRLLTWGQNFHGSLGNGTSSTNQLSPGSPVFTGVTQVSIDGGMGIVLANPHVQGLPPHPGPASAVSNLQGGTKGR
jgi:alpha-tubulin suppressor-like RCC1 family protein